MPFFNTLQSNSFVGFKKKRSAAGGGVSGKLFMWGSSINGNLGTGNDVTRSSPVQVGALTTWAKLSTGNSALATQSDGTLWSWGGNAQGQLGQNNLTYRSSPVQIGVLTDWLTPEVGVNSVSFCIKTDGTLWAWGRNNYGGLGLGNTTNFSSPVQVGSSTTWSAISAGDMALAVDNGKLFSWGSNQYGGLGLGDAVNRSSPVQIGNLQTWATPSAGALAALCVKTDGTLWSWGQAGSGQLGLGDRIRRSSPVQVGALTDWASPAISKYSSLCVKTDGTLWSWGNNGHGELGLGYQATYPAAGSLVLSPKQVGALTSWVKPFSGSFFSGCVKNDGTLWAWGRNNNGQLGLGDIVSRSSPVQVGALTNWFIPVGSFTASTINSNGCLQTP